MDILSVNALPTQTNTLASTPAAANAGLAAEQATAKRQAETIVTPQVPLADIPPPAAPTPLSTDSLKGQNIDTTA